MVWVPKVVPCTTLVVKTPSPLVTPNIPAEKVSSDNEVGGQATSKIARHSSMITLMLSGSIKGFEILVRENLDVTSMRLIGQNLGVVI